MGTGKAVVSTPYWHAEELLAEGRGCLVPPEDPKALAREVISLLDDEVKRTAMRKRIEQYVIFEPQPSKKGPGTGARRSRIVLSALRGAG